MTDEELSAEHSRKVGAALLCFMGVLHFAIPKAFDRIIPAWVPGRPRFWTYASGAAELTSGALMLQPRTSRAGAAMAAATLTAVYPANVQLAIDNKPTTPFGIGCWFRLPLQFPMIAWALRHTRS